MSQPKAKESREVKQTREYLKKSIKKEKKQFTTAALNEVTQKILSWIGRHEGERVKIKLEGKEISLFDENRHPAKIKSHYITHLQKHVFNLETAVEDDKLTQSTDL